MSYDTLTMLKAHAIELLGIEVQSYTIDDITGLINNIKTPFTNTQRKQFTEKFRYFIQRMKSNKIYHYRNYFGVSVLIFKYNKQNKVYLVGPYLEQRPNEQKCKAMLEELNVKVTKLNVLKEYLLQIPVCNHIKAQKMCRLVVRFIKERQYVYEIEDINFNFHLNINKQATYEVQTQYITQNLEARYNLENTLLIAVENGNMKEAMLILEKMNMSVAGLKRVRDNIKNAQYKAFIVNVLCRKAVEKAGVNLLTIDYISTKYAKLIDQTEDGELLYEVIRRMVIEYTESAIKVKATTYSSKINKVIQYIEINLSRQLTLKQLASYVDLAPAYLSRIFNKEMGCSLAQFITELRLKKAKSLLNRTDMTVTQIAQAVGYQQTSYFTQKFKEYYKVTPLKYRNQ
ncbi:helix-turn-helix domain-containing protein [Staphylococcus arlettae]|uniref:AraC family transcriptional regulator n=1 Tax=Staphylococcus arlettae TaxID=29378 RepID=UPI003B9EAA53